MYVFNAQTDVKNASSFGHTQKHQSLATRLLANTFKCLPIRNIYDMKETYIISTQCTICTKILYNIYNTQHSCHGMPRQANLSSTVQLRLAFAPKTWPTHAWKPFQRIIGYFRMVKVIQV